METWDKPIEEMRQCLEKAQNLAPVKQQLDSNMSQGKSDPSEILPLLGEVKGHLEELDSINNNIDRLMKQIEEMLEMRDYELTEKEMVKVKRRLMDVEAISQQAKIYVEAAEKGPESLPSEIETYRSEQGVSASKVSRAVLKGAGAGAALVLGATLLPVVAPAVAPLVVPAIAPTAAVYGGGALGGGAIGGVDKFLNEMHGNDVEYKMLIKERRKLESRLNTLKTGLAVKQLRIDNVKKKIESEVRITGEVRGEI